MGVRSRVKENTSIKMVILTMVHGSMILNKDKESIFMLFRMKNMMDIGIW